MSTDQPTPEQDPTDAPEVAAPAEPQAVEPQAAETDAPVVEPTPEAPAVEAPTVEAAPEISSGLDIGSDTEVTEEPVERPEPVIRGKVDRHGVAMGTGRRKTSVARVRIKDGKGEFVINGRKMEEYFPTLRDQELIMRPLNAAEMAGKVDISVRVNGGGTTGQTGAVILGIARALSAKDHSLHHLLHDGGFLTRDGRMVERKKYGFKKARRSFQFSKR